MRADIDGLMAKRGLQAVFISGGEHPNTIRRYLSNGIDIHGGIVVKKLGEPAALVVGIMEIEEAQKSGLTVYTHNDFDWAQLVKAAEGDLNKAVVVMWGMILEKFGIPAGKIGMYGTGDLHIVIERVKQLSALYPQYEFVGETGMTLFDEAFVTKDADEIRIIREVANKTSDVLQATWDFIGSHRAEGDTVVKADGSALTIGDVKSFVRRALLDVELEDTDMIFAQGRDGGFPHSRGESKDALKLGQPIVFDLFPRQLGGGYFHDVTRTWCIGHAPEKVQKLYDTVMQAFKIAVDTYEEPGQPTRTMQEAVMTYFEGEGHPTGRSHPGTTVGYMHGLGHGVGLNIHERPSISHLAKEDVFQKGNFITIEPGLYYPDEGMGMRVEDSFIIDENGALVSITPFRKDLVLPLRGAK